MIAEDFAQHLNKARPLASGEWTACCPAHEDTHPSLSFKDGEKGLVLTCHAGCEPAAIVAAVGLTLPDLFYAPLPRNGHHVPMSEDWSSTPPPVSTPARRISAIYDYCDAEGTLRFQVLRYEPKGFSQRQPDQDTPGAFLSHLQGVERVLYCLSAVSAAIAAGETVWFTEGEKDADRLAALGLVATTNAGGVKAWDVAYVPSLAGAHVVILPDNDAPGQGYATTVAAALVGYAASVRVLELPDLPKKGDVSDWLDAGHTAEEIVALAQEVPDESAIQNTPIGWGNVTAPAPARRAKTRQLVIPGLLWTTGKHARPEVCISNICLLLQHHPDWSGKLWWDVVRGRPMLEEAPVTRQTVRQLALWLGTTMEMGGSNLRLLEECLSLQAEENRHDLIREWLLGLAAWDGTPRLDTWLCTYAGASDTVYGRLVSRMLLLAMVARGMDPGCLCRYVVILEGPEESGKSSLVRALAQEWGTELSLSLEGKEAHMMIQSFWLAELPELNTMSKTEEPRLKAFITQANDNWIPKYSNLLRQEPRRTVFVGTTNPEGCYLKGQTGNTRFLPLATGAIDVPGFLAIRDQLFAEALLRYSMAPELWWQFTAQEARDAHDEREARRVVSVYQDDLAEWLDKGRFDAFERQPSWEIPTQGSTTWKEIAIGFLGYLRPEQWADQRAQKEVAQALRGLGWEQRVVKSQGTTRRLWVAQEGTM